jgi:hypothetical protein
MTTPPLLALRNALWAEKRQILAELDVDRVAEGLPPFLMSEKPTKRHRPSEAERLNQCDISKPYYHPPGSARLAGSKRAASLPVDKVVSGRRSLTDRRAASLICFCGPVSQESAARVSANNLGEAGSASHEVSSSLLGRSRTNLPLSIAKPLDSLFSVLQDGKSDGESSDDGKGSSSDDEDSSDEEDDASGSGKKDIDPDDRGFLRVSTGGKNKRSRKVRATCLSC